MKVRRSIVAALAAAALGLGMAACGTSVSQPKPVTRAQIVRAADREVRWADQQGPWFQQAICGAVADSSAATDERTFASGYDYRRKAGTPTAAQVWKELASRC